jgi:hypothetical protein
MSALIFSDKTIKIGLLFGFIRNSKDGETKREGYS